MITQNKGEWSELYVFLKLLGEGVLYAADADLKKNKRFILSINRNFAKRKWASKTLRQR